MPQCTCNIDLGYELTTQDVTVGAEPQEADATRVVDVDIPAGKVVSGAGALLVQINGTDAEPSHQYWRNAVGSAEVLSGPHPSDATKWRFIVSNCSGDGGLVDSTVSTFRLWVAVATA